MIISYLPTPRFIRIFVNLVRSWQKPQYRLYLPARVRHMIPELAEQCNKWLWIIFRHPLLRLHDATIFLANIYIYVYPKNGTRKSGEIFKTKINFIFLQKNIICVDKFCRDYITISKNISGTNPTNCVLTNSNKIKILAFPFLSHLVKKKKEKNLLVHQRKIRVSERLPLRSCIYAFINIRQLESTRGEEAGSSPRGEDIGWKIRNGRSKIVTGRMRGVGRDIPSRVTLAEQFKKPFHGSRGCICFENLTILKRRGDRTRGRTCQSFKGNFPSLFPPSKLYPRNHCL